MPQAAKHADEAERKYLQRMDIDSRVRRERARAVRDPARFSVSCMGSRASAGVLAAIQDVASARAPQYCGGEDDPHKARESEWTADAGRTRISPRLAGGANGIMWLRARRLGYFSGS